MTTTLEDVIQTAATAAQHQLDAEAEARAIHDRAMNTAGRDLMRLFLSRVAVITGRLDLVLLEDGSPNGLPTDSDNLLDFIAAKNANGQRVFRGVFRGPEGTIYRARMSVDNLPTWDTEAEASVDLDLGKRCCHRQITMPVTDAVSHLAALQAHQHVLTHDELPQTTPIHICRSSLIVRA